MAASVQGVQRYDTSCWYTSDVGHARSSLWDARTTSSYWIVVRYEMS